jgi:hypothetical protein
MTRTKSLTLLSCIIFIGLFFVNWQLNLYRNGIVYDLRNYWPLKDKTILVYKVVKQKDSVVKEFYKSFEYRNILDFSNIKIQKAISDDGNEFTFIYDKQRGSQLCKEKDEQGNFSVYIYPILEMPSKIKIGETVSQKYMFIEYTPENKIEDIGIGNIKVSLLRKEDIYLEGRKFRDCLKFLHRARWKESSGDYKTSVRIFWLSPDIGKVKEREVFIEYDKDGRKQVHIINQILCRSDIE